MNSKCAREKNRHQLLTEACENHASQWSLGGNEQSSWRCGCCDPIINWATQTKWAVGVFRHDNDLYFVVRGRYKHVFFFITADWFLVVMISEQLKDWDRMCLAFIYEEICCEINVTDSLLFVAPAVIMLIRERCNIYERSSIHRGVAPLARMGTGIGFSSKSFLKRKK